MTSVHPQLDPDKIFERGFITKAEADSVELNEFASKVNLGEDGDMEGIWIALLTTEDREKYNSESYGEPIKGILLNHALCFYPNPTWGRVVEGVTNGSARPIFRPADQVATLKATHEEYVKEYPTEENEDEQKD